MSETTLLQLVAAAKNEAKKISGDAHFCVHPVGFEKIFAQQLLQALAKDAPADLKQHIDAFATKMN